MPTITEPAPAKSKRPDPQWANLFLSLNCATDNLRQKVADMGPQTDPDSLIRYLIAVVNQQKPNMEVIDTCLYILTVKMSDEKASQKLLVELCRALSLKCYFRQCQMFDHLIEGK